MRFQHAVDEFLAYLQHERGCSPFTVVSYRSDFRLFLSFLADRRVPPSIDNVTSSVVRQYVATLSKAGYAPSTIGRRVASLKSLVSYLQECEYTSHNPLARISTPKKQHRTPTYLTLEECQHLLDATDKNHFFMLAFRDKAILGTFLYTGIRRGELLALKLDDADLEACTLAVRNGKGGKGRVIPLCDEVIELLRDWLELRSECDHDVLFTTRLGQPLGKHGLQDTFCRAKQAAGIEREGVTIHTLRHTFASALLQNGADLVSIQRLLGHSSLDTTAIYLHVQMDGLREAVARHPLSRNCRTEDGPD